MGTMKMLWRAIPVLTAILAAALSGQAPGQTPTPAGDPPDEKIVRGKYLVEEVAKCHDCHTPKMENGNYIKSMWMKGATMNLTPAVPVPGWHAATPDVTGGSELWKRWGDNGMIAFLETGKTPRGGAAGAPMPTYKLKHEDAEAVVAYLKSLH
jgi:mono/diheme cytochrome c family protein